MITSQIYLFYNFVFLFDRLQFETTCDKFGFLQLTVPPTNQEAKQNKSYYDSSYCPFIMHTF